MVQTENFNYLILLFVVELKCGDILSIKNIQHKCDYCGKLHLIDNSTNNKLLSGKQKNCYCSKECKSLAQHTGCNVECDYCHKMFYRRAYHIDRQNSRKQNKFCSVECEMNYKSEQAREIRICEVCGKEFECKKKSEQRFCSYECQNKWQTTIVGEANPNFKQELATCTYCNKPFYAKLYKLNSGQKLFCSVDCRRNWFAEIYSQSEEVKEFHRKKIIEGFKEGKYSKLDTTPQIIVNNILDNNNIAYEREHDLTYYSIDNFLIDSGLIIEVMGDYWHCNHIKYNGFKYDSQKEAIRKDKAKHTYIKKYCDVEVLYLWEYDIINNKELCEKLILEYIKKNGKLQNYHSFNYVLDNNILHLSDNIIEFGY